MKKYWKVLLICMLIVTTISTYYIQAAFASKNELTMKLETVNGNEKEIENLAIDAELNTGYGHQNFTISKDGSTYIQDNSIFEGMISGYIPPLLSKLVQEHRQFLRGKFLTPINFFEDDSRLIYVNVFTKNNKNSSSGNVTFTVDILHKKTKERTSFIVRNPSSVSYEWGRISNIHVVDGTIKILTTLNRQMGNRTSELHLFEIDEQKQALTKEMLLVQIKDNNTYLTDGISSYESEILGNASYYLYGIEKISYEEKREPAEIYVYNTNTSEIEEWEIPANLARQIYGATIVGSEIFIPIASNIGVELHQYNFETKQWAAPLNITYPQKMDEEGNHSIKILNHKLYSMYRVTDSYKLLIHDLYSGEILYEGKVGIEDWTGNEWLYIRQIYHID